MFGNDQYVLKIFNIHFLMKGRIMAILDVYDTIVSERPYLSGCFKTSKQPLKFLLYGF